MGISNLKILLSAKEVKGKIVLCPLLSQVADFHLKWSMPMGNPKNAITGRSPQSLRKFTHRSHFNAFTCKSSFPSQEGVYTLYRSLSILKKDCENYLLKIMT